MPASSQCLFSRHSAWAGDEFGKSAMHTLVIDSMLRCLFFPANLLTTHTTPHYSFVYTVLTWIDTYTAKNNIWRNNKKLHDVNIVWSEKQYEEKKLF